MKWSRWSAAIHRLLKPVCCLSNERLGMNHEEEANNILSPWKVITTCV